VTPLQIEHLSVRYGDTVALDDVCLTVAAGGYVLANTLLLIAGTLVGASGTFLTLLMAKGMGRSVANVLFGALKQRILTRLPCKSEFSSLGEHLSISNCDSNF